MLRERGGELRFFHTEDVKTGTLPKYIKHNVTADVDVMVTHDFASNPFAMDRAGVDRDKHKAIRHNSGVYVMGSNGTGLVRLAD